MENIETLLAAVAAQTQGFDDEETINTEIRHESELSGAPIDDWGSMEVYPLPLAAVPAEIEKKRRGRPPRGQMAVKSPPLKKIKQDDEDEDVCFICFDGGSLVLCDRKGCPKAYHPACIKRDEAFFSTKAKWNCGWHICSVCRKNSHYMCYTCTYSLCKRCTKDEQYVRVRENKGFCATCMKTIMLIENKDQANSESVKVDFDDKLSWEYLFKVYWVLLKEKLSLTLTELTEAKNPWDPAILVSRRPRYVYRTVKDSISFRGSENLDLNNNKPHKDISFSLTDPSKEGTSNINNHVQPLTSIKAEDPEKPMIDGVNVNPSIVKAADEPVIVNTTDKPMIDTSVDKPAIEKDIENPSIVENINKPCICKHTDETKERDQEKTGTCNVSDWATKDLLEFVAHMKNGDKSHLSQFDVQTLLLDYIKRNNLRDPHQKSQIICDLRLTNLFGRARVGHIEMLKLLEYHFLINADSQKKSFIPAGLVGSPDSTADGNNYSSTAPIKGRKRKSRKKSEEKLPQNNLSEFAAIDFHNINLIYLRHKLMENLVEDKVNFNDKVIGSIVRIKISSSDQKPDVHRLVQVVGTSKVTQPYKVGDKTTDIMLEVLNLDKKETVSVDSISNLEFTEDECRRLRQSIRCGLMKQFTVGEIQNKAMALQSVRVNDWLEAEILRLNHLRDRASEKGRKKELREYVQKLQLLKSAEERQRRISEVPVIHADPKMSPNYESEEDAKSRENNINDQYPRSNYPGLSRGERKAISPYKKGKQEAIPAQNQTAQKVDTNGSHRLKKHRKNQVPVNDQRARLETSIATASMGNSPSVNHIETEKLWHYRDPNGKIQGPFSMMQLRKWSTTGLFPPDMRIWTNHEQYDSVLLTHAMSGQFHGPSERPQNTFSETQKQEANARDDGINVSGGNSKQTETATFDHVIDLSDRISKQTEAASFNRGIDLSVRENKQSETASANHAIDLSGRGSIQTKAVSANQAVDYSERDGKQTNAAPNHTTVSSERNFKDIGMASSNHADDILEICKQINAASSSSPVDLSERDSAKTNRASSDHGLDLSEESKHTNAASFNNAIDFSDRDRTKANAASSNHAIDLSDRDGTKANAASSNHAIDLSDRDSTKANAASSNHSIDFSDRDSTKANASTSNHVIDSSQRDNKKTDGALNHTIDSSVRDSKQTEAASSNFAVDLFLRDESKQTKAASSNHAVDLSDGATGSVKADETNSPAWPQCWDLLTDSNPVTANVQASNVLHSSSLEQTCASPSVQDSESGENDSHGPTQNQTTNEHEVQSDFIDHGPVLLTAEETLRSLSIDLMSESEPVTEPGQDAIKHSSDIHVADLNTPVPNTSNTRYEIDITETQQCISSDMTRMKTFLELLSPTPRSSEENQANDEKQSGLLDFSLPNSGTSWTNLVAGAQLPDDVGDEWCGYSPTPTKQTLNQEWDPGLVSLKPPTNENVATNNNNQLTLASPSYPTSWLAMLNEPIEFDALGEESVSDLLAEVDAMESQGGGGGGFPSPTSAMKFAKELLQDCKDDCFSSIEDFSSATHPVKSDAFSSTGEVHLTSHSSGPSNPTPIDFLDTFRRSGAHSSASSEGETNAPAFSSSEFHHPHQNNTSQDMVGPGTGSDTMDPGWGNVQGNINLVTVQGNVNLVLGPGQGMTNLGWGTNPGAPWANPNVGSLPWDGNQRKYEGERFTSPREWGYQGGGQAGFGRGGRPPWGRQGYGGGGGGLGGGGGGGYSRPLPKGQRVCKFYESGRCKKGAFCDYLHP